MQHSQFINKFNQLNMFRAFILPILMSARLCVTACGITQPRFCRPATSWVRYTTSCNTQSRAPEDVQNKCPKRVELTGIINKPLLLHLVGCLYYLYQWWTVKQISNLTSILPKFNAPLKLLHDFCMPWQHLVGKVLLTDEVSRSHSDTPHLVWFIWTADQPVSYTSTSQHTTLTTDRHPCPRRDSNPQPHQARCRILTS